MYRTLLWLLMAVLTALAFGVWWLYGEVVLVWFTLIGNFIKGISLRLVLSELLGLLSRWFFVELPKRFLMLLVTLGMPARYRRKIKRYLWRARELARTAALYLRGKLTGYAGENVALLIAIVATIGVALIGFMSFGFYFVWIFGGAQIWRVLRWTMHFAKNLAFKVLMFFQLDRLGRWLISRVPKRYASFYRQKKQRALRYAVHRRRTYRRWVTRVSRRGLLKIAARTSKVGS